MPSDDEYGAFHAEFEAVSGDVLNVPAARDMFRHGWKAGRAFESHRLAASLAREARLKEALEWYANEANYDQDPDNENVPGEMIGSDTTCSRCRMRGCREYFEADCGKRAQAALAAAAPAAGGQPRDGEEAATG